MNQSPSANQKTEADGVPDSESSLQKPKSQATQLKIPTNRKIQIPKKLVGPSDSKDAWKQMFGTFLHDINLKQKKNINSEETSKTLQDPLVNITPLEIPCNKKQFKLELYKFLDGQQSIDQMMNAINFPSIMARTKNNQIQEEKKKGFAKKIQQFRSSIRMKREKQPNVEPSLREKMQMKQIRLVEDRRMTDAQKLGDQLRFRIQRKLQVLKDFIQERIDLRKKENSLQREEDVRNINFIKRFFDITSDYNQQILKKAEELDEDFSSYKKQIPCQKKLKQLLVKFDNVKPIVQHQEEYLDKHDFPTQGMLKHMMGQQSKDYLQELENEKQVRFKDALRQVNKLLEAQNIKLRSKQSSKSNSPQLPQHHDSWLFDVPVASPKNQRKTQISMSSFKDGIIEYSKRKNYVITKKPFYLFNKKFTNDKNPKHSKGLITMYDLRLYDYIHNKKIYSTNPQIKQLSQKFHTMVESEIEQSNDQKLENKIYQMNYHVRKCRKTFVPNSQFSVKKTDTNSAQELDSDDGSLQSIYEVNLDNLYHQSHTLAKKLNSSNQGGFAKRLKQLMKLEEVNKYLYKSNIIQIISQNQSIEIKQVSELIKLSHYQYKLNMNQQYNKELLMFPLEILVFCSLAFGIFKMKKYYPNILFPPQGVTIILPPDEEDMKLMNEKDRKAKPIQQLVQVKTLKSEAAHFLQAPFSNELEITMLFIVMLFSHFFIIEMFKIIAELLGYHFIESGMLFYFDVIIIMMIIRNIFNAANIGGYDSQQTKMSISVCVISSLVVILINIGFQDYLNINIKHEFQREAVHLEIVLRSFFKPGLWSFMSQFGDIFIIFLSLIVSFFIYCILPVLIRFGNCFSEYKNEQNELQAKGKPVDKRIFYFLVFQLILPLFYIASYLKPFTKDFHYVFPFQFCSIIIIALFQISTYTCELDKHMQKGYQWALVLKEQPEMQELVKKKMQGLLRGMVIVSYQLLSKIMIPILLFMILLLRNQYMPDITERYQQLPALYQENEMYCVKESINVMKHLFGNEQIENEFIDESKIMVKRISNYGFLTKSFIYSLIEFVLFNYNLLTLILTVFYIFFLSKTQAAQISKKQKKKKQ